MRIKLTAESRLTKNCDRYLMADSADGPFGPSFRFSRASGDLDKDF